MKALGDRLKNYIGGSKILKTLLSLTIATVVIVSATGCASGESSTPESLPENDTSASSEPNIEPYLYQVTSEDIDKAVKTLVKKVDEFTEDEVVTYEIPLSVYTKGEDSGTLGTLAGQYNRKSGEDWVFQFAGSYVGEDWIFWDTMELKSPTESLNFKVSRQGKTEKVLGDGRVGEIGALMLTDMEVVQLFDLVKGGEVKFRLSSSTNAGSGNYVGVLGTKMRKQLINVITVYFGELKGDFIDY